MATLITPIPTIAFPHELAELEFEGAVNEDFSLSLLFDGEVSYLSTLELSETGDLSIDGIDTLVRTFAAEKKVFLRILINGTEVANCHVLPCHVQLDQTAAVFTPRHFLTRNERQRTTADGTIWVHIYAAAQVVVNTTAVCLEDGRIARKVVATETIKGTGIHSLCYEVATLTKALTGEALAIIVEAGERSMRFDITEPGTAFPIRYNNCFGRPEILIVQHWESKYVPTYESAMMLGRLRNVSRKAHREIKCTLSDIREGEVASLEDLAGSDDIVDLTNNRPLLQLSLDFRTDSSPTRPITGTITLREATASPCATVKEPARTFDDSFDTPFN